MRSTYERKQIYVRVYKWRCVFRDRAVLTNITVIRTLDILYIYPYSDISTCITIIVLIDLIDRGVSDNSVTRLYNKCIVLSSGSRLMIRGPLVSRGKRSTRPRTLVERLNQKWTNFNSNRSVSFVPALYFGTYVYILYFVKPFYKREPIRLFPTLTIVI